MSRILFVLVAVIFVPSVGRAGSVESHTIVSRALSENRVDLDPARRIRVYLPDSYRNSDRRYPVLYYIPFGQQMLDHPNSINLFDSAIAGGRIGEFILVTGDFSTPHTINFFGNNTVTGHWLDFIKRELVTYIDHHYRTLTSASSRGICGHFLGGYAALKLAMLHPETFNSVYALHPVATDTGERSMLWIPNWQEIHAAKTYADLQAPYSNPFVAMAQAHLPNPKRPPFYANFIVEKDGDELLPNTEHFHQLNQNFLLADLTPRYRSNLKALRAIGFDWGRNDYNQAHVYGARKYVVALEDYGLRPEAVEHSGDGWDYDFSDYGHINMRMLPFFARYLEFGE